MEKKISRIKIGKYVSLAILLIIISASLMTLAGMVGYVDIGEAAVVYDPVFHEITKIVYGPAYFIKLPWQGVKIIWLRVETIDMFKNPPRDYPEIQALTRDGATVYVDITVRYQVIASDEAIKTLINRYPLLDFEENVIVPLVRETVRNVISKYELTEVIEQREDVRLEIINEVVKRLENDPTVKGCLNVIDVAVRNIDFPQTIKAAIEAKLAAQQEALAAQYMRQKTLIEANASAEAKILEAQGEAQAQIIRAQAQMAAIEYIIKAYNSSELAIQYYYILALQELGKNGNLVIIVPQGGTTPPIFIPLEKTKSTVGNKTIDLNG
ncbi:MAG: prohibitin family protein [Thermoproteales archaeon]|nr:prohibitin family protein [Thermoproteales archaeon]